MRMARGETTVDEIPVGLYLLRRIRELGCKTVQGLPGMLVKDEADLNRRFQSSFFGFD